MISQIFKNKNKIRRLAIGLLLTAPIGASFLMSINIMEVIFGSRLPETDFSYPFLFLLMVLGAYLVVGIQSLMYSVLMEYLINPRVNNSMLVVVLSIVLGTASSLVILISGGFSLEPMILGAAVGLTVGTILRWMYVKASTSDS